MLFTHLIDYWALIKHVSVIFIFLGLCFLFAGIFVRSENIEKGTFKKDPVTYSMVTLMQILLIVGVAGFAIVTEHIAEGANYYLTKAIIKNSYQKTTASVTGEQAIKTNISDKGYEKFAVFQYPNNYGTIENQGIKLNPKLRKKLIRRSINYRNGQFSTRLQGQQFVIHYSTRFPSMFIIAE
ncbi:hypothetical protein [Zunongwangia sp. HRR-M8]|uniref:hypothetical protein n=1 Tax=Zunongwangia sp. HRR-M8 TaxID=3015170 RepID=UPI0022DE5B5E|nr:hypothetical protein [Zunongwangia sp. HRR-M8]WBL21058.1 hypothetical protein PBT89_09970 [Zunongwangia sp. HRR-M8]